MSGNCAIGMAVIAIAPASVMTMAMTRASRGRSMKMPENISAHVLVVLSRRHARPGHDGETIRSDANISSVYGSGARRNNLPGPHLLDAFDDDQLSLLEAGSHDDVAALLDSGGNAAQLGLFRRVDDKGIAARLIELDRSLRNDESRSRRTPLRADAHHAPGNQKALGVWHLSPY